MGSSVFAGLGAGGAGLAVGGADTVGQRGLAYPKNGGVTPTSGTNTFDQVVTHLAAREHTEGQGTFLASIKLGQEMALLPTNTDKNGMTLGYLTGKQNVLLSDGTYVDMDYFLIGYKWMKLIGPISGTFYPGWTLGFGFTGVDTSLLDPREVGPNFTGWSLGQAAGTFSDLNAFLVSMQRGQPISPMAFRMMIR